jgi:hypothetical protein
MQSMDTIPRDPWIGVDGRGCYRYPVVLCPSIARNEAYKRLGELHCKWA